MRHRGSDRAIAASRRPTRKQPELRRPRCQAASCACADSSRWQSGGSEGQRDPVAFHRLWTTERLPLIQEYVQRGISPACPVLIRELFQLLQVLFTNLVAGLLISRIAEINPAPQRPRFARRAQVVDL